MKIKGKLRTAGFSLVEMLVVVLVFSIIMAGVFRSLHTMQVRSAAEQTRLDLVQPGREGLDVMARELGQAGVPNARQSGSLDLISPTLAAQAAAAAKVAVGLTDLQTTSLEFEGDVDGDGNVDTVTYSLVTGDDSACKNPSCIKREQAIKGIGTATPGIIAENLADGNNGTPVFVGIRGDDDSSVSSATYTNDPTAAGNLDLANINRVRITLVFKSPTQDLDTKQRPSVALSTTVKLRNCSPASSTGALRPANACY